VIRLIAYKRNTIDIYRLAFDELAHKNKNLISVRMNNRLFEITKLSTVLSIIQEISTNNRTKKRRMNRVKKIYAYMKGIT